MTLGVVLASILLQGMTMAPLLRRLGIVKDQVGSREYDRARAELRISTLALAEVESLLTSHAISDDDAKRLAAPYEDRRKMASSRIQSLQADQTHLPRTRRLQAVRHLLTFERDAANDDLRHDVIVPDTHEEMSKDVATRLLRLEAGEFDDPADLLGGSAEESDSRPAAAPLDSDR